MRIIIAGGGTGGHIFPALAIANALRDRDPAIQVLFIGAKGKMEMEKVPAAGYEIVGLDIAGYNRSSLIKNVALPLKLLGSFFQVRKVLRNFKPDAVIGVGGYSSFPVLRTAQKMKIPTFIHESNSLPGRSNILVAKRATEIFVAAGNMEKYFPLEKIRITGNPVRKSLLAPVPKDEALAFFGLQPGKTTVFVMGGSLGARSINEAVEANIDFFKKNGLQLIWQTGKNFAGRAARVEEERSNIWSNAFVDKMENAYAAADIVISRSGAMTVAELCVVGKPAIFVPYPFAAEDHQTVNASVLVDQKAAFMVSDGQVNTELFSRLLQLIKNEALMGELKVNISKLGITNADEVIASEIIEKINQK